MKFGFIISLALFSLQVLAQAPVLHLDYNEADGTQTAKDIITLVEHPVRNNFYKPERVTGVEGNALRLDGFSTWVNVDFTSQNNKQFSFETWISLESYPSDDEVIYSALTPSAIVSQMSAGSGYRIGINTFGRWFFEVITTNGAVKCEPISEFPLYEWAHVVATIDTEQGVAMLFLNGNLVSKKKFEAGGTIKFSPTTMFLGKSSEDKNLGIFLVNALNGTIDETKVYEEALSEEQVLALYGLSQETIATDGEQAVVTPGKRFVNDPHYPSYHLLPPANWTNEPHGLLRHDGKYHIFYQRTPNGPYKVQMHWGHAVSADLVNWKHTKDALWPTLDAAKNESVDMKGIWSGDVVVENGKAHAFYTCVNHSGEFNPGVALATSDEKDFIHWKKQGALLDKGTTQDMRDPYLWKENGTWHMIIGARKNNGGDLAYYTSTDLLNWTASIYPFFSVPMNEVRIGADIWEMPVFEKISDTKYILVVNPIGGDVGKYGPKYTRAVYWIGSWNGTQFTPDFNQPKKLDVLHGHLSPTVARNDNDEIQAIGIVDERRNSQSQLDAGWCHLFSLPRQWYLMPDEQTLGQKPIAALTPLRTDGQTAAETVVDGKQRLNAIEGKQLELIVEIDPMQTGEEYGVNFCVSADGQETTRLYYNTTTKRIYLDKSKSSKAAYNEETTIISDNYDEAVFGKPRKFHIFIDGSVIDVFINDAAAFSNRIYPIKADSKGVELYASGSTKFTSVKAWSIQKSLHAQGTKAFLSGQVIQEGHEDGAQVMLNIRNNSFVETLNSSQWEFLNLPTGLTASVERVGDTDVKITFSGIAADYSTDIRTFTVKIPASEFSNSQAVFDVSVVAQTAVVFRATVEPLTNTQLVLLGEAASLQTLNPDEKAAYDWAIANRSEATYFSFDAIANNKGILHENSSVSAVWWHLDSSPSIPAVAQKVVAQLRDFIARGGAVLLTGFATQFAVNLGVESNPTGEINYANPATSGNWGFYKLQKTHPLFAGLSDHPVYTDAFATISEGLVVNNHFAWWNNGYAFSGTALATLESRTDASLVAAGVYTEGTGAGRVLVISAGAYDWHVQGGTNLYQANLEQLTANALDFLIRPTIEPTEVQLSQTTVALEIDQSFKLIATVLPENAEDKSITWASDNEMVASVKQNGIVTALAAGTANVYATTNTGGHRGTCVVTVKTPELPTRVEEPEMELRIYPNPVAQGQAIQVEVKETFPIDWTVDVLSVSGQQLIHKELKKNKKIEISHSLSKGSYFLRVSKNKKTKAYKLIVK